jgi:SOS response associated peptidase (SRAP)
VIPAEGFYEWREEYGKKQPYFFARKDGRPVMFAGIWDYSDVKCEAVERSTSASYASCSCERPRLTLIRRNSRLPVLARPCARRPRREAINLKWPDLWYVFDIKEDSNGNKLKRSLRSCGSWNF